MQKKTKGFWPIIAYLLLATLIYYVLNTKSLIGIDDANIYFVYMRNLAKGYGFVFNQGGEKVEGFTSLLWTLIGALLFKLSEYYNILLIVFNIILISIILFRLRIFFYQRFPTNGFSIFLFLLAVLLVIPGFIEWTILSLLETGLWCFLLVMPAIDILEFNAEDRSIHYSKLSIYVILMTICRPEAMLWIPFFIIFNTYKEFLISRNSKFIFNNIGLLLVFAFSLFLLVQWRINYFGYPLPNTYYAKVSTNISHNLYLGLKYVGSFLIYNPVITVVLMVDLLGFIYLCKNEKLKMLINRKNFDFLFLFSIFLLSLFIPFYTGGDYFANYRFMQPTIPLILISVCTTSLFQKLESKRINVLFAIPVLVLFVFFSSFHNYNIIKKHESKLAHEFIVAKDERFHSRELNKLFSVINDFPSQGVMAAGSCGYVYNGETIDMLALNNLKMAHSPQEYDARVMKNHAAFRKKVFFKQKPDLFWIAGDFINKKQTFQNVKTIEIDDFNKIVFKHIDDLPQFKKDYVSCIITIKGYDKYLRIFASRVFLKTLDSHIFQIKINP
ncbi:hypothetical protein [Chryseobacterium sp. FH1]|uniref:hypothetical protein n=1 Tax=Chryseobacterium sp. FH1 TaxID=1233951 RepID=UPI000AE375E9|nr:hypothetical protein [Chryseobacterium sp. FH1]